MIGSWFGRQSWWRRLAVLAGVTAMAWLGLSSLAQRSSLMPRSLPSSAFKTTVTEVRGLFFRFDGDYVYLGKPLKVEFLFSCGGTVSGSRANGDSWDLFGGPQLYALKLSDGKALAISTRSYCSAFNQYEVGQSTFADLLPVAVLYDDAESLTQGWAYMSDYAYERPQSPLKFIKASLTRIAGKDVTDLAERQEKNMARFWSNVPHPRNARPPMPKDVKVATKCYGFYRMPLPEKARELVRAAWPADRPKYWMPVHPDGKHDGSVNIAVRDEFNTLDDYVVPSAHIGAGLPRLRSKGGLSTNLLGYGQLTTPYLPLVVRYLPPGAERQRINAERRIDPEGTLPDAFRPGLFKDIRFALEGKTDPDNVGLFRCGGPWASVKERERQFPELAGTIDYFVRYAQDSSYDYGLPGQAGKVLGQGRAGVHPVGNDKEHVSFRLNGQAVRNYPISDLSILRTDNIYENDTHVIRNQYYLLADINGGAQDNGQ